jgi:uncharacterized protein (TIGR01244 family)
MRKTFGIILLTTVLSVVSFADDTSPTATLKVDLATVVSEGTVLPVNGVSTAGQPDEAALAVFAKQGYTTVIDIRGENENRGLDEAAVVADLGMEYVNFPIAGADAINFDNARTLAAMIKAADGPVLVHCGSANRVGALLALEKSIEGASDAEALEFGTKAGMSSLKPVVEKLLSEQ